MTDLLVLRAEVAGRAPADVRITGGRVAEVTDRLAPQPGDEVIDARGGALLPGLCDHHLHLHAIAAAFTSVQCGPPAVTSETALAAALAAAPADDHGWIRGVSYSEEVAGLLDSDGLDRLRSDRPVRIQHRSGSLWIINSVGAQALDLSAGAHPGIERDSQFRPTGRLWRADNWLRQRLPYASTPDLRSTAERLTKLGITHVTDATASLNETAITAISQAMETLALPQRVHLLGAPLVWIPTAGRRSPTVGPYKIILADPALPDLPALTEQITQVHASGRSVAVHCVTREALVLLLAALADAGSRPGDRIEHGAVIPIELIPTLRSLRVTIVTQPGFLHSRGDFYLREVPPSEHSDLYRAWSLIDGGVNCVVSSDAPYGPLDPWAVITASAQRVSQKGQVIGRSERLATTTALAGYLSAPAQPGHSPRRVAAGENADLVLLHCPLASALARPSADYVAATIIDGEIRYMS